MGKEWRFEQLGGDRRVLTLTGEAAPHGRPRQGPVVSDGIKLRHQVVYYPGNDTPTRHVFGAKWDDWELKGRFADRYLGVGGTKAAIADWIKFCAEAQEVGVQWGDVVFGTGLVLEFTPGRESEFESSYRILVGIDSTSIAQTPSHGVSPSVALLAQNIQAALDADDGPNKIIKRQLDASDRYSMKPDLLESLEDLVSAINTPFASVLDIAQQLDDIVGGTVDQLERLRAGVAQTRTAVNKLRRTLETTENDLAILSRSADEDVQWFAARSSMDVSTLRILAILDEMDREAELAQRGRILTVYVARGGDTFESIATALYGGPSGAGLIREANGARYGELPIAGRQYQVPLPP